MLLTALTNVSTNVWLLKILIMEQTRPDVILPPTVQDFNSCGVSWLASCILNLFKATVI